MNNNMLHITRSGFHIPAGATITGVILHAGSQYVTLGGTSDIWGATWTADDINRADFGSPVPSSFLPLPEPIIVSASK